MPFSGENSHTSKQPTLSTHHAQSNLKCTNVCPSRPDTYPSNTNTYPSTQQNKAGEASAPTLAGGLGVAGVLAMPRPGTSPAAPQQS